MSKSKVQNANKRSVNPKANRILVIAMLAMAIATFVIYSPAFRAPFEFDDIGSIPSNTSIQRIWPLSVPLDPPANTSVAGRPVVNLSFALNYALNDWLGVDQRPNPYGPAKTIGYRVVNVLLHIACGLFLLGILRRTLRHGSFAERWASEADTIGIAVVALWLLHPIQTEAINYIVQRTELLVSVCYLGALYAAIRAWDARSTRTSMAWRMGAVTACLIGVGSKEVIFTAPLVVLLYDRAFRLESWRALIENRVRVVFYAALMATSALTVGIAIGGGRSHSVGFDQGIAWYEYAYSQAWAIAHYLRLILWPDQLTLDYGQAPIGGLRGLPGMVLIAALSIATIAAWLQLDRWRGFAFLGAWFFLTLAPSSSVVPIVTEIAAERRVYLASAAALVAIVVGIATLRRRISHGDGDRRRTLAIAAVGGGVIYAIVVGWTAAQLGPGSATERVAIRVAFGIAAAAVMWILLWSSRVRVAYGLVVLALGATTIARSRTYLDPEGLWRDTIRKAPGNPRAYDNLAFNLFFDAPPKLAEAKELYWRALALDSTYLHAWPGLATIAVDEGKPKEAEWLLGRALAVNPNYADAVDHLGRLLADEGQPTRAIPYLARFASTYPSDSAFARLGTAYLSAGELDSAAASFKRALALNPTRADAAQYYGGLLVEQGRGAEAIPLLEGVAANGGATGIVVGLLGLAYAEAGRTDEAVQAAQGAAERANGDASVYMLAGRAMLRAARAAAAAEYLSKAVELQPSNPEALTQLGLAARALEKRDDAARLFRRALALDSNYRPASVALASLTSPVADGRGALPK